MFPVPSNSKNWFTFLFAGISASPPSVISSNPISSEKDFKINRKIYVIFDEAIQSTTSEPIQVYTGRTKIAGTAEIIKNTLKFTPESPLSVNSKYTVSIKKESITDLEHTSLSSDYNFSFETGETVDTTAPFVNTTNPSGGSLNIAVNQKVSVQISEPVDANLDTSNVELYVDEKKQDADITFTKNNIQITPKNGLVSNTVYTLKVKTGITDTAGNHLQSEYSSTFQTGTEKDETSPSLSYMVPANNSTNVSIQQKGIVVLFSEDIDDESINNSTFQVLESGTNPVQGAFFHIGRLLVFYAVDDLLTGTVYTIKIKKGIRDLSKNSLDKEYTYEFKTAEIKTASSQVTTFSMASPTSNITNGSTGVAIQPSVKLYFTDILDPNIIDSSNISIKDSSNSILPVSYSYEDNNKTVVISPASSLSYSNTYTVEVTTALKSLLGSKLNAGTTFSFTTIADPGTTTTTTTTYTVGGTISGLAGTVVLQNNSGDNLTLSANGNFTFATALASSTNYSVTVLTQPSGQTCSVSSGMGTATANVASVSVSCGTTTYTIGGSISGLSASGLVLQNNTGNDLTVSNGATSFTFSSVINSGSTYSVTVLSQPSGQTCVVTSGGSGTVTGNVTNVGVNCVSSPPTYTQHTIPNAGWTGVTYGNSLYVIVSINTTYLTSTDGTNWTQRTMPNVLAYDVAFGGGKFVTSTYNGQQVAYSTDGINWNLSNNLPISGEWYSIAYGASNFVIVLRGASTVVATSPDGATWTQRTLPVSADWRSIAYGNGTFVIVAAGGNIAATSADDGLTWTQRTLPAAGTRNKITFGNGLFVTVNDLSSIADTSPDGITWTQRTLPQSGMWRAITYGAGHFIAPLYGSTTVAVSTDGITWTQQTLPASANWVYNSVGSGNGKAFLTAPSNTVLLTAP